MSQQTASASRRREQTHAALVAVAQQLLAEGRAEVSVLEITKLAGVGLGSFYNHFETKDEFFLAGLDQAAESQVDLMGQVVADTDDPAEAFARKFRLTGRLHREQPFMSRALVNRVATYYSRNRGLVVSLRDNIHWGVSCGRFTVRDPEGAVGTVIGSLAMLGQRLTDDPELDSSTTTDLLCEDMLRMLGLAADEARIVSLKPLRLPW